jgi:hypothetical protein
MEGHGFSRAEYASCMERLKPKPLVILYGTAEAVPFHSRKTINSPISLRTFGQFSRNLFSPCAFL